MCENKWKTWFDMGGADGSFGLQCIFNVECTIAMLSLSGMCWRDMAGRSCSHIFMIGQIFKALLELAFSFLSNNTILWWAQLSPFDRFCTVHLQYRLYLYYKPCVTLLWRWTLLFYTTYVLKISDSYTKAKYRDIFNPFAALVNFRVI